MHPRTIAIDLAKDCFELAVADERGHVVDRHRLNRARFGEFMANTPPASVVMEACGSAHYWGRTLRDWGHAVRLLPAQYVRPYRRGNKTDRADADALLEASRCAAIEPVPIKSVDQQQIQQLHRLREQWKGTRVARINALRGALRELGIDLPVGARAALKRIPPLLDAVPSHLRLALKAILDEIEVLEIRMLAIERSLVELAAERPEVQRLRGVEGIGLLNATALVGSAGSPRHFKSGRHFASWLGLTPRESSSGRTRVLGRITKRGNVYLRTLLIHGARSVLARAKQLTRTQPDRLSPLQRWAMQLERRIGHNKATVALANKLARICWAVWQSERPFERDYRRA